MPLHPLVSGFAEVADDYEYGRPGYPPEAVAAAARGLRLAPGARIADVGAGTGKLTRALAAAGFDVVAVEPLPGLRERLRAAAPGVEALAGTAEALPLPDASVDAVACADAFHWFDGPPAVAEFARVIRPGGGLALLWNMEDDEAEPPPWHVELGDLLERVRPEHPSWTDGHEQGRGAVAASPAFGALALDEIRHEQATDRDRLIALVALDELRRRRCPGLSACRCWSASRRCSTGTACTTSACPRARRCGRHAAPTRRRPL